MLRRNGIAWMSDYYGTAATFRHESGSHLRTLRRPFAPREDFRDFYRGAESTHAPLIGFITCSPLTSIGNAIQRRTMAHLGLPGNFSIAHAGDFRPDHYPVERKARIITSLATEYTALGFVDDEPTALASALVKRISGEVDNPLFEGVRIVLGAVAQSDGSQLERIGERFEQQVGRIPNIASTDVNEHGPFVRIGESVLQVVRIGLGEAGGVLFANHVHDLAEAA